MAKLAPKCTAIGKPRGARRRFLEIVMTSPPPNPPTIARLKAMGVAGVFAFCRNCKRSEPVPFDVVALPDETLFSNISKLRRFRCEGCGSTWPQARYFFGRAPSTRNLPGGRQKAAGRRVSLMMAVGDRRPDAHPVDRPIAVTRPVPHAAAVHRAMAADIGAGGRVERQGAPAKDGDPFGLKNATGGGNLGSPEPSIRRISV